ncbi:MAG: SOS response-associated peptidase [Nitrospina sp.]|nr:SOS response-associated peptidase [Nitrospina sp.]
MCGRYTLAKPLKALDSHFGPIHINLAYRPCHNIAPSQLSPVVINSSGNRELTTMKWGFVPSWAKNDKMKFINARSETASEKPSFKGSLIQQRCLIPADGFLEWQGPEKQPYYIYLKDRSLFAFAGLWSTWNYPEDKALQTYTILTTEANKKISPIHSRMPIILPKEQYQPWLTSDSSLNDVMKIITSFTSEELDFHPVSKEINRVSKNTNSKELLNQITL